MANRAIARERPDARAILAASGKLILSTYLLKKSRGVVRIDRPFYQQRLSWATDI
jgi:hypothetical protein